MMPLSRIFDRFSDAEDARDELLAGGLAPYQISLTAPDDEAGPVEGTLTHADTAGGPIERIINWLSGADKHIYSRNDVKTAYRGVYRLQVAAQDAQQLARAADIMRRFGGVDVEARAADRRY
jgi:hypothetical protein